MNFNDFSNFFPREDESEEAYVARMKNLGLTVEKEGDFMRVSGTPMPPEPSNPKKDIDETRKGLGRAMADYDRKDREARKNDDLLDLEKNAPAMAEALKKLRVEEAERTLLDIPEGKSVTGPLKVTPPRSFILDGAKEIVYGARQHMYGHASINFERTAHLWTALFGRKPTNLEVGATMLQLKMARLGNLIEREKNGGPAATFDEVEDTMKDIAGYAEATMRSMFETPDGKRNYRK